MFVIPAAGETDSDFAVADCCLKEALYEQQLYLQPV
jgi:hypothetical protein